MIEYTTEYYYGVLRFLLRDTMRCPTLPYIQHSHCPRHPYLHPYLHFPLPLQAYVDFFSRSLNIEYKSKGIIVQSVLPFFVTSKLSKIRRANLFVPDPTTFVKSALSIVGVESRTFGYAVHAVQVCWQWAGFRVLVVGVGHLWVCFARCRI